MMDSTLPSISGAHSYALSPPSPSSTLAALTLDPAESSQVELVNQNSDDVGRNLVDQSAESGNRAASISSDETSSAKDAAGVPSDHDFAIAEPNVTRPGPYMPPPLAKIDTIFSADSIEFSPLHTDIFFCGTYQIEQLPESSASEASKPREDGDEGKGEQVEVDRSGNVDSPDEGSDDDGDGDEAESSSAPAIRRKGRALLYRLDADRNGMTEIQRFDGPAILDAKWTQIGYGHHDSNMLLDDGDAQIGETRFGGGSHTLAIGNAEGQVSLHQWDEEKSELRHGQVVQVTDPSILCLSVDWSPPPSYPGCISPAGPSLMTSLSSGDLAHLVPGPTGELTVDQEWKAHEYEPWITSFDLWSPNVVWSGGDDCVLKRWDLRETSMATSTTKGFDGGVTTISSSPHTPNLLAVGSYDEHLRLFDTRNMRRPIRKIPVGGGVWRTRWNPVRRRKGELVLACMHGGFRVLKLTDDFLDPGIEDGWTVENSEGGENMDKGDGWETMAVFKEHSSIAYGVDWSRVELGEDYQGRSVIASCSFYDHSLMLWKA